MRTLVGRSWSTAPPRCWPAPSRRCSAPATDDCLLSATSQISRPVWRRRTCALLLAICASHAELRVWPCFPAHACLTAPRHDPGVRIAPDCETGLRAGCVRRSANRRALTPGCAPGGVVVDRQPNARLNVRHHTRGRLPAGGGSGRSRPTAFRLGASSSLAIRGGSQTVGPRIRDSSPPNRADRWAELSRARRRW